MSDLYRDRSEGSAARRQDLLRRRRDELVTMPHAVRRVVVARASRVAASMVATAVGLTLIAAAAWPAIAAKIAAVMPGDRPAPLATTVFAAWVLALIAWAVSRARVEHRFAVAMSRYVLPSQDVDHDVERLDHEHPDAIARAMAHGLEVRSAAWPLLAAGVLVPATALWLASMVRAGGWSIAALEDDLIVHAPMLATLGVVGAITAIALTRSAVRARSAVTGAGMVALAAGGFSFLGAAVHPLAGWALVGVAAASVGVIAIALVLHRERAQLEVDDPAAGSELFTWRGAMQALRAKAAVARAALLRIRPRYVAAIGAAALVSVAIGLALRPRPQTVLVVEAPAAAKPAAIAANAAPAAAAGVTATAQAGGLAASEPSPRTDAPDQVDIALIRTEYTVDTTLDAYGVRKLTLIGLDRAPARARAMVIVDPSDEISVQMERDTRGKLVAGHEPVLQLDGCDEPLERDPQLYLVDRARPGAAAHADVTVIIESCDR